ncbi:MAG: OmpA family protein [Proteobacteria bacterium]|jgi:chemotaxis protein MotB|nr:OmpA family protein [Pseudomonadota bacterium]
MRSYAVTFLGIALAALVASCGIPQEQYDADMAKLKAEIDKARGEANSLQTQLARLAAEKQALESEITALQDELKRLAGERDANADAVAKAKARIEMFKNMLAKFKKMLASGKIKIRIANNKMIVEMASAILFPSGKAKLSEEGETALAEVASILATIGDRAFQVAGHTDNIPIDNKNFGSNWELSAARAVAVVEFLIEKGMAAENLSAAGYADTQPVAGNLSEEGRAQNRRIEIVLQPSLDELPDLSSLEKMID